MDFLSLIFSIVRMSYRDSKMPTIIFYAAAGSLSRDIKHCKNNFFLRDVSEINNCSFDKNAETMM